MIRRLSRVLLVLILLFGWVAVPPLAGASENIQCDTQDYVLVIDATMHDDLGELCKTACELLLDILPRESTRVGVIAYGYDADAEDVYEYTSYQKPVLENARIHQLAPLAAAEESAAQMILQNLDTAFSYKGKSSPHGQALLAAADMLSSAGTADGAGHVILISDGIRAVEEWNDERISRERATSVMQQFDWPIYTIQITDTSAEEQSPEAEQMMTELAQMTNAIVNSTEEGVEHGRVGTWNIDVSAEASAILAMQKAVMELAEGELRTEVPGEGEVSVPCAVGNLTCEYVVAFSGADLTAVTVQGPHMEPKTYTSSAEDGYVSVARKAEYFVVRLNTPTPAEWSVVAHTDGTEPVAVYRNVVRAANISLSAKNEREDVLISAQGKTMAQDRQDSVYFTSDYSYLGQRLEIDLDDASVSAELEIEVSVPGKEDRYRGLMKKPMTLNVRGHTTDFVLLESLAEAELKTFHEKTGSYRARVVLSWEGADVKSCASDWFYFGIEDTYSEATGKEEPLTPCCHPNEVFTVNVEDYIIYKDEDPLQFSLVGRDGGETEFLFVGKNGERTETYYGRPSELKVQANDYVGTYELTLRVVDGPVIHPIPIVLTVLPYEQQETLGTMLVKLYEKPFWNTKHEEQMDDAVINVTVEEGFDSSVVDFFYDQETNTMILSAKKPGETTLHVDMEYAAYVQDQDGEYVPEKHGQTIEVKVLSNNPTWGGLSVVAVLVVALSLYCGWHFYKSFGVNGPWDCELIVEEADGGTIPKYAAQLFQERPLEIDNWADKCLMGTFIMECLESTSRIEDGKKYYDVTAEDIKLVDIVEARCKDEDLKKLQIKGTRKKNAAMRLAGIPVGDENCEVRIYEKGKERPKEAYSQAKADVMKTQTVEIRAKNADKQTVCFRINL